MDRRTLERRLEAVEGFREPRADLEQYPTPADLTAHLVHLAALRGDLGDRTVVDLGAGTGRLALGAALGGAARVVGVERDPDALAIARGNERRLAAPAGVDWVLGDATRPPVCPDDGTTVLMNPPFGAQRGNEHADRAFLDAAARLGTVSYSIHNEGSRGFVEAFAGDRGGRVTDAFAATLTVDRQFPFHAAERADLPAEAFRIEWP